VKYYELPRSKWWLHRLALDSPFEIGGLGTDLSEIALSLSERVQELFGEHRVPAEVYVKLGHLCETLTIAEEEIQEFIGVVSGYVADDQHRTFEEPKVD
jgi:hypothetical protein